MELGKRLRDWAYRNEPAGGLCREPIEELYRLYNGLGDMEQVITDLEFPDGSPVAALPKDHLGNTQARLQLALVELFNEIREAGHPSPDLYAQFAVERIRAGDVIITFNYDLACERALKKAGWWEINGGYGGVFEIQPDGVPPSNVTVLKLHGSMSWRGLLDLPRRGLMQMGGSVLPPRPVLSPEDSEFLGYAAPISDPLVAGGRIRTPIPALIMPTRRKRFYVTTSSGPEWEEFWADLWRQAEDVLRDSENIVIIGYSMPAADTEARRLLLETSNKNACISVWCGETSSSLRDEFVSRGFTRVAPGSYGRFKDFLDSQKSH